MGTGVAGFGTYAHFSELNEPLDTQEGVLSPADRKARCLDNLGLGALADLAASPISGLTDSTGGTPGTTLAAITAGAAYAQADAVAIKNAIASINAKLDEIIAALAVA
jgi:hypothetical protein